MTPTQLTKLGVLAFGPRWKTALKDEAGISREQIWRYESGRTPISDEVAEQIKAALRRRFKKQRDQIDAAMKAVAA